MARFAKIANVKIKYRRFTNEQIERKHPPAGAGRRDGQSVGDFQRERGGEEKRLCVGCDGADARDVGRFHGFDSAGQDSEQA